MAQYENKSDKEVCFEICDAPGVAPKQYKVAPGESCEVPDGYCKPNAKGIAIINKLAPALVPASEKAKPAPKAKPKAKAAKSDS